MGDQRLAADGARFGGAGPRLGSRQCRFEHGDALSKGSRTSVHDQDGITKSAS
jgi:hypothetical protein